MVDEVVDGSGAGARHSDLANASLGELIAWRNQIDAEINVRGYARTAGPLVGELMERVVADAYGGDLASPGAKSADVTLPDSRRVQVKARLLPAGALRHWAFHDLDFDLAVVVALDRATTSIVWARELTTAEAALLARPHSRDGLRVRMAAALTMGKDVTEQLREAYRNLR